MSVLVWIALFFLFLMFQSALLYVAARITGNPTEFKVMFFIALGTAIVSMIPGIGNLMGLIMLFYLLTKLADMRVWPDAVLTVIVSGLLKLLLSFLLIFVLAGLGAAGQTA